IVFVIIVFIIRSYTEESTCVTIIQILSFSMDKHFNASVWAEVMCRGFEGSSSITIFQSFNIDAQSLLVKLDIVVVVDDIDLAVDAGRYHIWNRLAFPVFFDTHIGNVKYRVVRWHYRPYSWVSNDFFGQIFTMVTTPIFTHKLKTSETVAGGVRKIGHKYADEMN